MHVTQSVEPLGENLGFANFGRHWSVAAWIQEVNTKSPSSDLKLTARVDKIGDAVENVSPFHFCVSVMRETLPRRECFRGTGEGFFITETQRSTEDHRGRQRPLLGITTRASHSSAWRDVFTLGFAVLCGPLRSFVSL